MPDKQALRQRLLSRRDAIPPEVRTAKSRLICERIAGLPEFASARTVLLFAPFRSEVDTLPLLAVSLAAAKRVLYPKVDRRSRELLLFEVRNRNELAAGYQGIPEPAVLADDRRAGIAEVDAAVVPGAGFDMTGARIGYGGGYYDRLLALTPGPVTIAPAFEEQLVAEGIRAEAHDRPVSLIVTDRRVIDCRTA